MTVHCPTLRDHLVLDQGRRPFYFSPDTYQCMRAASAVDRVAKANIPSYQPCKPRTGRPARFQGRQVVPGAEIWPTASRHSREPACKVSRPRSRRRPRNRSSGFLLTRTKWQPWPSFGTVDPLLVTCSRHRFKGCAAFVYG